MLPLLLTILLPSTAPSSALSLRSGSACDTLLGKTTPADLGRLLRPYGAEHMHATASQPEPSRAANHGTQTPRAFLSLSRRARTLGALFLRRVNEQKNNNNGSGAPVPLGPTLRFKRTRLERQRPGRPEAPCASPAEGRVTFSRSSRPDHGGATVFRRRAFTCEEDLTGSRYSSSRGPRIGCSTVQCSAGRTKRQFAEERKKRKFAKLNIIIHIYMMQNEFLTTVAQIVSTPDLIVAYCLPI